MHCLIHPLRWLQKNHRSVKLFHLVTMLLFGGTAWTVTNLTAAEPETKINIVQARYGTTDQWLDVTTLIQEKMSASGTKELKVDSNTFGDPAPYQAKRLEAKISLNGQEKRLIVEDGCLFPLDGHLNADNSFQVSELQRQIEIAYAKGDRKMVIKPALYRLVCPKTQSFHLSFWNMKDFEIDATGSTFIFEDKDKCGIRFQNCRNVRLKGATLIREIPPFSQGIIKARGKDYLDIEIHEGYPNDLESPAFRKTPVLTFYDKNGIVKKGFTGEANIAKIEKLGVRLFRFYVSTPSLLAVGPGDLAAWRRRAATTSGEITLINCATMKISGVTIKNGILVNIKEAFGDGGNYYNYTVTFAPPPQGAMEKPLLASAADGFYSQLVRQGPVLENCLLEGMHDDAVNINGRIWVIKEVKGNNVTIEHWVTPPQQGDLYQFFDVGHRLVDEAKIVATERTGRGPLKLILDREISPKCKTALNASRCGAGFIIRNCTTRNHRGRGFLVRSNGIIENCVIEDMARCAISLVPEFLTFNEGPYASNLVIRNNTIRRCPADCWGTGGSLAVSSLQTTNWEKPWRGPWTFTARPGGFRNILVEGNRFEECDGPNISISSAIGVTVKNNIFANPMKNTVRFNATMPANALVYVTESEDVKFENNVVENPGEFMKRTVDQKSSASIQGTDGGFMIKGR